MADIRTYYYILRDDAALAVSILENLAKVPRFDLIIMCLSSMHKSGELNMRPLNSFLSPHYG
jgi:hypothetical protein